MNRCVGREIQTEAVRHFRKATTVNAETVKCNQTAVFVNPPQFGGLSFCPAHWSGISMKFLTATGRNAANVGGKIQGSQTSLID